LLLRRRFVNTVPPHYGHEVPAPVSASRGATFVQMTQGTGAD
jgi:hypothetical protein